ncbi:MAG: hypothetical protein SangKO_009320 [Sandaracinaceae bacterium]
MEIRNIQRFDPEPCPIPKVPVTPPSALVEPGTDNRLIESLRKVAAKRDPLESLAAAARTRMDEGPNSDALGQAMSDLAVTGAHAWRSWSQGPPSLDAVIQKVGGAPGSAKVRAAAEKSLARATLVARLLPLGGAERATLRAAHPELQTWIGVCAEVDPPHRPVNNEVTDNPQRDLRVPMGNLAPLRIRTSFIGDVANAKRVVLWMHGLGSRLEEADRAGAELTRLGDTAIVAFDFPSSGYSQRIDLADASGQLPMLDVNAKITTDFGPFGFLDFLDDFVANFVDTLEAEVPGVRARIACTAGGSLGGNMSLRLALTGRSPWIPPRIVAWSPASVWSPVKGDLFKDQGPNTTYGQATMAEDGANARKQFFFQNFDKNICNIKPKTAQMWWRSDWVHDGVQMQQAYIDAARVSRQEVYGEHYRRFTWRLAYEQLLFSFRTPTKAGALPRYHLIGQKMRSLLLTGQKDAFDFADIYAATDLLAKNLDQLHRLGRCYLLTDTGHSIHDERPVFLAREIDAFLRAHG